ncbi:MULTISPECIES: 4Fe-4S dicluster domain-containing protein [Croceibacter]|uniref:4Fe-4S dicluster domain-containing protein n=1 Tax=Croceibacter TaxID=216431 RepID=UPI000C3A1CEC|nr:MULTISPECIES: 4Fe-4S dicluster domain-containing protein [Croceibacter]MAM22389.1 FeS-binding protein [Croceibacter sp.]MBG24472.1 FeS-binding protein [Croceibacter sp.]WSP34973.1 4Fe-4S dicluster domain-containing protein [Croceibacter atlanticus]|tara:strand:- start:3183 stop:5084 length:1902 start_codon:yes stop_codon:yes gene_type:complete
MSRIEHNMSLTGGQPPKALNTIQKISTAVGVVGLGILLLALLNVNFPNKTIALSLSLLMMLAGIVAFSYGAYSNKHEGIKNDGVMFKSITSRGLWGWILGIAMTGFYVVLYFYPQYLGLVSDGDNTGVIALFDPLSKLLSGNPASQWFLYGTLYTLAIFAFGIKFIWKYRNNTYEVVRTISVMFFQTAFAFIIPEILVRLNQPYYDFKNIWPLNYELFAGYKIDEFLSAGNVGLIMLIFGLLSIFVITPILTYKYGKRWYCSWVCGCGGLAETAGDPFRHLSDKSQSAWKIERWVIHSVVVFVTVMTVAVVFSYLQGNESSSISEWSNLDNKVVFMSEEGDKPIGDKILAAQQANAKGVVFINKSSSTPTIQSSVPLTIDYIVVNEAEQEEALKKAKNGENVVLQNALAQSPDFEVAANQDVKVYDDFLISKEFFIWFIVILLTLVFGWAMLFKREELAKDAQYGAIGYFVVVISLLLITYFSSPGKLFLFDAYQLRKAYGFLIGAIFSGVIGVGFYPIFGSRVWCRFGCPMAAILGFQQRLLSKFRITTNGGQCISCGNCSTYCEMGIDVRAYAQKGENIVRSSCVGCGICSAVCPRGVLKLENDSMNGRINSNDILLGNDVNLMDYLKQHN